MVAMDKRDIYYFNAAKKIGLDVDPIGMKQGFGLNYSGRIYYIRNGTTPLNVACNCSLFNNKYSANLILHSKGIPVPEAFIVGKEEYLNKKSDFSGVKYPVVAKPVSNTSSGKDVVCNIRDLGELTTYLDKSISFHENILIEKFYSNLTSYRVLVLDDKVIAITRRDPAKVVGDGRCNILKLINLSNQQRKKIDGVSLGPIKIDQELEICLSTQSLEMEYIPKIDEIIMLQYKCNSTVGGTMKGLDKNIICPENIRLMVSAARVLGLRLVGFDVVCEDIAIPLTKSRGVIIEGNFFPDITIHENPVFGISTPVAEQILRAFVKTKRLAYMEVCLKNSIVAPGADLTKIIKMVCKTLLLVPIVLGIAKFLSI